MARARTRTDRRGRGARRPVEWLRGRIAITTVAGAAGATTASAFNISGAFPAFIGLTSPTVVRIRGELTMSGIVISSGLLAWAAGFVKMSLKAFTVGILAVPIPTLDDADWMWFHQAAQGDGGTVGLQPEEDVNHVMIDTKAMRKFEQTGDDMLAFVVANLNGVVGEDLRMAMGFSVLVKE